MDKNTFLIDVIGHIGWETHVLIENLDYFRPKKGVKDLATNIINVKNSVGGSAFFANIVLQRMGITPKLITSIGNENDDWSSLVIKRLEEYPNANYHILRRGKTNWFLSLWEQDAGNKKLYCHINSNLTLHDILTSHSSDADAVIIYGLINPPMIMEDLISIYKAQNTIIALVPNQTLCNKEDLLKKLLPKLDILFLNTSEALKITETDDVENAIISISDLIQNFFHTSVCITKGKGGYTLISNKGGILNFSISDEVRFALGGGDILAASTTAIFLQSKDLVTSLTKAVDWTALIMKNIEPF